MKLHNIPLLKCKMTLRKKVRFSKHIKTTYTLMYIHLLLSFSRGRKDGQVWSVALSLSRFPTPCVISCLPDGGSSETRVPIFYSFWNVGNSFGWFGLLMVSSVFYWKSSRKSYSPVWNYVPYPWAYSYSVCPCRWLRKHYYRCTRVSRNVWKSCEYS